MEQRIVLATIFMALATGCTAEVDAPQGSAIQTETQSENKSTNVKTLSEHAPLTIEECKALHSSDAKDAIDAAKAACNATESLPEGLSGPECVRKARYDVCSERFSSDQLRSDRS
jgi:hypothetical protein